MKKNTFRLIIALALCVGLIFAMTSLSQADFGNFAGDNDYGGGDWGGGDWGGNDDWDWGDSGSGGSGSGSPIMIIVVGIIILIIILSPNKRKNNVSHGPAANAYNAASQPKDLRPISEYVKLDPNFDSAKLTEKISNLYVQMQQCWQDKDIESLRPYMTDAMFAQMDRQLDALRRNEQTNYIERIAVLGVSLDGFNQSDGNDHIYATVNTRIVDYTVNKQGTVVSGSKNVEKFMTYRWHLVRPTGQTTASAEGMRQIDCPNCGAPLNINQSARCPYCESIVTLEDHDFVLTDIQGVSQRSSR